MTLIEKVRANLILEHTLDDDILKINIAAAISYAEGFQHKPPGYYLDNPMSPITEQGVIMLASHFFESRDGGTGGFFADSAIAGQQVRDTVDKLLRLDRDWAV